MAFINYVCFMHFVFSMIVYSVICFMNICWYNLALCLIQWGHRFVLVCCYVTYVIAFGYLRRILWSCSVWDDVLTCKSFSKIQKKSKNFGFVLGICAFLGDCDSMLLCYWVVCEWSLHDRVPALGCNLVFDNNPVSSLVYHQFLRFSC